MYSLWEEILIALHKTLSMDRHRCSPVNFVKSLRTHFLQNTSGGCFRMNDTLFTSYTGDNTHYATTSTIDKIMLFCLNGLQIKK